MRVLVTGGTGFIGSNLALALEAQGHEVSITGSMHEQPLPEFKGQRLYLSPIGINWESIGKIDAVFHLGAISDTRMYDRDEMFRANVETSKKVFEYAAAHGAKYIAYASSCAVYGNTPAPFKESGEVAPTHPYGESKVALEEFATDFAKAHADIRVVGLRYSNVYGPRENHKGKTATMIYQFAQQMKLGNPKVFKWGEQKRDYIYVQDAVEANLLALEPGESGIFNCGSGSATAFNDLVAILNNLLGTKRVAEYIDNPYSDYQAHTECDMTLAKEKLGFSPSFDIEKGMRAYFDSGFLTR
jgi:ADP-L-glycero-D-manno-heptose 6-epimerase